MKNRSIVVSVQNNSLMPLAEKLAEYIKPFFQEAVTVKNGLVKNAFLHLCTDSSVVQNGYLIKKENGVLVITGSSPAQTVRGGYAFLEKLCGIRMYTKTLVRYEKEELSFPGDVCVEYHPPFECTSTDWLSPKNSEYSLFNGLNGAPYREIPEELGSTVNYISGFCHTLSTSFCSAKKYFEAHPEYFALRNGRRKPLQLCLSNPEVLEIVSKEVFDILAEKHDASKPLQIISLSPMVRIRTTP